MKKNRDFSEESIEEYLRKLFEGHKPTNRQLEFMTGRGGAILSTNLVLKQTGRAALTSEEESLYRGGLYSNDKLSLKYVGYPFESSDGHRVVKERGHWYLDQIQNNWAFQVKKLTEKEAQELIKQNRPADEEGPRPAEGFSELVKEGTYIERELLTVKLIKKYFRETVFSRMPDRLSFIYPPSPPSEEEE